MMSNEYGLLFIYADITDTAATLEKRHLSGPSCSVVLGQALIAAAFLSSRLKGEQAASRLSSLQRKNALRSAI